MRKITTFSQNTYDTPLFLPVFQYRNIYVTTEALKNDFGVNAIITNAFLLYKNRDFRSEVLEKGIKKFLGFDGLIVTDSGAFQQFTGSVYLSNSTIVEFQDKIGADVISPLDVITTRGDNRTIATKKWEGTFKRIQEGMPLASRSILIGVQQGGKFMELRKRALEELVASGSKYVALGGLVPFFNKNHDIEFISKVILQARKILPDHLPIHLYGGGDPLEIPFYIALGCDIFDSSSFIHYADDGWYMTPYGSLQGQKRVQDVQYVCECPYCKKNFTAIWRDTRLLAMHNLWTILHVFDDTKTRSQNQTLLTHLEEVVSVHQKWFPESLLERSWTRAKAEWSVQ